MDVKEEYNEEEEKTVKEEDADEESEDEESHEDERDPVPNANRKREHARISNEADPAMMR